MKILLVAAYKTGLGKRYSRDDFNIHRNLVEVFKNNKFGENGVLSCFANISSVNIQIMPTVLISTEEAERIEKDADEVFNS